MAKGAPFSAAAPASSTLIESVPYQAGKDDACPAPPLLFLLHDRTKDVFQGSKVSHYLCNAQKGV
jgi:hypothetical protein